MKHVVGAGIAAAALAVGCDSDPTSFARVEQVRLSPEDTTVEHPDSFRYRVELLDANGDPILDSRPMTFTPSDLDVATVSSSGWMRTRGPGVVQIVAKVGGPVARATLHVAAEEN